MWDTNGILARLESPEHNAEAIYRMLGALHKDRALPSGFLTSVHQGSQKYGRLTPKQNTAVARCLVPLADTLAEIAARNITARTTEPSEAPVTLTQAQRISIVAAEVKRPKERKKRDASKPRFDIAGFWAREDARFDALLARI